MRKYWNEDFENREEQLDLDDPLSILLAVETASEILLTQPTLILELRNMPRNRTNIDEIEPVDPRIEQLTQARDTANTKVEELKAKLADVSRNRRLSEEAMNKAKQKHELLNSAATLDALTKLTDIFVEERSTETQLEAEIAGLQTHAREAVIQLNRLVIEEQANACKIVLPDMLTPTMKMRACGAIAQMCQYQFATMQYSETLARARDTMRAGATFLEFENKQQANYDEASMRRERQFTEFGILRRAAEKAFLEAEEQLTDEEANSAYKPTLYWKTDAQVLREEYERKGKRAIERAEATRKIASEQRGGVALEYAHLTSGLAGKV